MKPLTYAAAAFTVTPLAVVFCILMGAMLATLWPLIPLVAYAQRRSELKEAGSVNTQSEPRES